MIYGYDNAHTDIVKGLSNLLQDQPLKGIPLYWEDSPEPNVDKLQQYTSAEITYSQSKQVTIGENPIDRTYGVLVLTFAVKENTGTRKQLQLIDYFKQHLKGAQFGSTRFLIPSFDKPLTFKGWNMKYLYAPFFFDGMPVAEEGGRNP